MSQHRRYVMRMMLQMKLLYVMLLLLLLLLQLSRFRRIMRRVGVGRRVSDAAAGGEASVGGVKAQQRRSRIVKHGGGWKTRQRARRNDVERKTMRRRQRAVMMVVMMMMVTQMAKRVRRVRVCGAGSDAPTVGRRHRSATGQIRQSEADARRRCQEARQRGKLRRGGRKEGMDGGGNDDVARWLLGR